MGCSIVKKVSFSGLFSYILAISTTLSKLYCPIVYNEKEANEAKERSGTSVEVYNGMLPAYGMLPTLQLPCLYGFTASRDTITKSDNTELRVLSVPEVEIVSDGDYNMGSSGGDSGDIVPTAEDDKNSILADTDKVGISLLGSSNKWMVLQFNIIRKSSERQRPITIRSI